MSYFTYQIKFFYSVCFIQILILVVLSTLVVRLVKWGLEVIDVWDLFIFFFYIGHLLWCGGQSLM